MGALLLLLGAQTVQSFIPPRTAVVDQAAVFENYDKVKDRQAELNRQFGAVRECLKELEKQYKGILAELQVIQKDTQLYSEKRLELKKLELESETVREKEGKALSNITREFLKEIGEEIGKEIKAFARAQDLDLVLEKTVTAQSGGGEMGFRWPIVHHVRSQIDITQEIIRRLNAKYRKR